MNPSVQGYFNCVYGDWRATQNTPKRNIIQSTVDIIPSTRKYMYNTSYHIPETDVTTSVHYHKGHADYHLPFRVLSSTPLLNYPSPSLILPLPLPSSPCPIPYPKSSYGVWGSIISSTIGSHSQTYGIMEDKTVPYAQFWPLLYNTFDCQTRWVDGLAKWVNIFKI